VAAQLVGMWPLGMCLPAGCQMLQSWWCWYQVDWVLLLLLKFLCLEKLSLSLLYCLHCPSPLYCLHCLHCLSQLHCLHCLHYLYFLHCLSCLSRFLTQVLSNCCPKKPHLTLMCQVL
jgi:hypothetical protein